MSTPHVQVRGVTKRFGATIALADVDVDIARGSVHALVGENGAGKSTLGRLLAGVHKPDEGQLLVAGRVVSFRSPREALACGITMVAQELSLVPTRTVAENVFLGIEPHLGPLVNRRRLRDTFGRLVLESGIAVDPDALVRDLSVADQQKVELLRALARQAELIVMDEPSARLTAPEMEALGATIRGLAEAGTTVVLVSHFLEEVLSVSDTVTVMRDGRVVRTAPTATESRDRLITGMIGRRLGSVYPPKAPPAALTSLLQVRGLSRRGAFHDISFDVGAGEIVVLAGLVGAGRTEVVRTIFGAERPDSGQVTLGGLPWRPRHPRQALRNGVTMIPEARKAQGLQLSRAVQENVVLPHLSHVGRAGFVSLSGEARHAAPAIDRVGVKAASPTVPVGQLSGGNQQKVLFARSLMRTPRLLIADEPTRGVDVGAKCAIYQLLADQAAAGMAVLVVSSELDEVVGLAHRVLVMREGRVVAELSGSEVTEKNVVAAAFGAIPDYLEEVHA
jgi:simple sugar transport system ATP-binding protein/ribose transport system ATP-binding protein